MKPGDIFDESRLAKPSDWDVLNQDDDMAFKEFEERMKSEFEGERSRASVQKQLAGSSCAGADKFFRAGQQVFIGQLRARADLNGKYGHVISYDAAKGRYAIELESASGPSAAAERILLKPINLSIVGTT
mmetsp:Transcript_22688/g.37498  ORF Transcript_22688/g.37498 Transcript_22688/m.37498 type:complete len:130 (-) Transcript_22688:410-799(-)